MGDDLRNDAAGDDAHGSRLIRQYAGKNITATTAGLAYNLGVAHGQITAVGVHTANVGDGGNQNYDFNDRGAFGAGHNLIRYTQFKLIQDNPLHDAGNTA